METALTLSGVSRNLNALCWVRTEEGKLRPGGHTWPDELLNPAPEPHNHSSKSQMKTVASLID